MFKKGSYPDHAQLLLMHGPFFKCQEYKFLIHDYLRNVSYSWSWFVPSNFVNNVQVTFIAYGEVKRAVILWKNPYLPDMYQPCTAC